MPSELSLPTGRWSASWAPSDTGLEAKLHLITIAFHRGDWRTQAFGQEASSTATTALLAPTTKLSSSPPELLIPRAGNSVGQKMKCEKAIELLGEEAAA